MILVTRATGSIGSEILGSEILRLLSEASVPARALARNPQKAQKRPDVTWIAGDLAPPSTLTSAFEGARTVFLLTHYLENLLELQHKGTFRLRDSRSPCRTASDDHQPVS